MTLEELGIGHGFIERTGGVSSFPYDSLNVKVSPLVQDSIASVASNLKTLLHEIEQEVFDVALLYLEGGSNVITIDKAGGPRTIYGADGAVTKIKGCTLAITVADCLPILLVDKKAGVIGISHAGWKGSSEGVTSKVVAEMVSLGANPVDIVATIGPGICGDCYEVGQEVAEQFDPKFSKKKANGKHLLNLYKANWAQLVETGVAEENVNVTEVCTYENTDRFFSARKDKPTGRFLAYISFNA